MEEEELRKNMIVTADQGDNTEKTIFKVFILFSCFSELVI